MKPWVTTVMLCAMLPVQVGGDLPPRSAARTAGRSWPRLIDGRRCPTRRPTFRSLWPPRPLMVHGRARHAGHPSSGVPPRRCARKSVGPRPSHVPAGSLPGGTPKVTGRQGRDALDVRWANILTRGRDLSCEAAGEGECPRQPNRSAATCGAAGLRRAATVAAGGAVVQSSAARTLRWRRASVHGLRPRSADRARGHNPNGPTVLTACCAIRWGIAEACATLDERPDRTRRRRRRGNGRAPSTKLPALRAPSELAVGRGVLGTRRALRTPQCTFYLNRTCTSETATQ